MKVSGVASIAAKKKAIDGLKLIRTFHKRSANKKEGYGSSSSYRGVVRHVSRYCQGKPWYARLIIKKKVVYSARFRNELHAAIAYDIACEKHKVPERQNFIRPAVRASLPLRYASLPKGWRFETTVEKLSKLVVEAVMALSTPAPQVGTLFCKTYSQEAIDDAVLRSNHGNGGDPTMLAEFETDDDDKVMEELEKIDKQQTPSLRGKVAFNSIAELRKVAPAAAEAVEELMNSRAGGATPIRIQVNVYGEDGVDSSIHKLHLDPIKHGDTVLCWSLGSPAEFCFGGKMWRAMHGALMEWTYESQEVHGIIGADGARISIAVTY